MISYYSSVIILCWLTLGVLGIQVYENSQIAHDRKKAFYLTYILIAVAALAERLGVMLDSHADLPFWVLRLIKCLDYILTPIAGGSFILQMPVRRKRRILLAAILGINTVFQLISLFTPWMVIIDEQHRYHHGSLYWIYILLYLAAIILVVLEFFEYGRAFRRQNRTSLFGIMLLMLTGITMQEVFGAGTHRTVYLAMTVSAALMLIQYIEFLQMTAEDLLAEQKKQNLTDPLTGLQNRQAFTRAKLEYSASGQLPERFAVFMVDINGLKEANDRFGHEEGDRLIRGAAECLQTAFGSKGTCYRVGGDEFVVFAEMNRDELDWILWILKVKTDLWTGPGDSKLSLAAGYACTEDHPGLDLDKLIFEADQAMYNAKAQYYMESGHDRRISRRQ